MSDLNEIKNLKETIAEAMGLRGFGNIESLAQASDIPIRYLSAFLQEDFSKLPAAPYVKGYLVKIAEVLGLDGEFLWDLYKKENSAQMIKTSGAYDKLPSNRFAIKSMNKAVIITVVVLLLGAGFFTSRFSDFFGTPGLEIVNPSVNNFVTNAASIKLSGRIDNPRDKLTINGEEILIGGNGFFEHDFSLQQGVNTIDFKVSRFLGKEFQLIKQVIYQPQ